LRRQAANAAIANVSKNKGLNDSFARRSAASAPWTDLAQLRPASSDQCSSSNHFSYCGMMSAVDRSKAPMQAHPSSAVRKSKESFIPIEVLLHTAGRFRLWRLALCHLIQRSCYDALRIPELLHSPIRDSGECAAARWPPVGRQDRFLNNQNRYLTLWVPRQELLSCGSPPQAARSRRRKEQHQPGSVRMTVKSVSGTSRISATTPSADSTSLIRLIAAECDGQSGTCNTSIFNCHSSSCAGSSRRPESGNAHVVCEVLCRSSEEPTVTPALISAGR